MTPISSKHRLWAVSFFFITVAVAHEVVKFVICPSFFTPSFRMRCLRLSRGIITSGQGVARVTTEVEIYGHFCLRVLEVCPSGLAVSYFISLFTSHHVCLHV